MLKLLSLCLIFFSYSLSYAAGDDSSHGGVSSLLYPLINFIAFAAILVWATKSKLKTYFTRLNEDVQEVMERASKKAQESAVLLAEQEGRLANLDSDIKKLFSDIEIRSKEFEKSYEEEISQKIDKLEQDTQNRIESERKIEIEKISGELLDQVIFNVKSSIKDKAQKDEVAQKLVEGMNL